MNRLEHRWILPLGINVPGWRDSNASQHRRTQVREDVAEQIAGNDDLKPLGMHDEIAGQGINVHLRRGDLGVVLAHFLEDFVPEYHRVVQGVGFGGGDDIVPASFLRVFKGIPQDALRSLAGENALLHDRLVRLPFVAPLALAAVFAFAVLPYANEIHALVLKRRGQARKHFDRTNVDVLIELDADREKQLPQRDVVRHSREADGAKQDGVAVGKNRKPVVRHHLPMLQIVFAAPRKLVVFK